MCIQKIIEKQRCVSVIKRAGMATLVLGLVLAMSASASEPTAGTSEPSNDWHWLRLQQSLQPTGLLWNRRHASVGKFLKLDQLSMISEGGDSMLEMGRRSISGHETKRWSHEA